MRYVYPPACRARRAGRRVLSLFCIILLLPLSALAAMPDALVPLGVAAGIRLPESGVTVAGLASVDGTCPAREAGLLPGDVLLTANGAPVDSPAALQRAAEGGSPLTLTVRRGEETLTLQVTPIESADGWRIGVWVRDSMLGIGTLTYYNPTDGSFGALGHGITELGGDRLIPLAGGAIVAASVPSVQPGASGAPGELHGSFDGDRTLGTVEKNTAGGIFGRMAAAPTSGACVTPAPAHIGEAQILACTEGETPALYRVRILRLRPRDENLRNLVLEVTDEALLERTGGIVQGMSGSPILQDGRLVGAVTHVLVNDPRRGYGISIENMLAEAG